ncbi:aldose 1-epimerase [Alternaria alternata]|nr:aldose 1-epimerase [Alternaria alternata]
MLSNDLTTARSGTILCICQRLSEPLSPMQTPSLLARLRRSQQEPLTIVGVFLPQTAHEIGTDLCLVWSAPHELGFASGNAEFENHCGNGCHGYNGAWAFNESRNKSAAVLTLSSAYSGIEAKLTTNQDAVVLYTCNWNDGKSEFKNTQGVAGQDKFIPRDGCIAIEAQDYVDGINQ